MKLLTTEQIRQWDEYTIQHEPVTSLELMERAAAKCTEWIISHNLYHYPVKIFCGKGNNGGDGLAIARQLIDKQVPVVVYILEFGFKGTSDFQANLQQLHLLTKDIHFIQSAQSFPTLNTDDVIIDALFGSGLNRALDGLTALLVQHINRCEAMVISIDVPSGMFMDRSSKNNEMIHADYTLTFQSLKKCLLVSDNSEYFGAVHVLDIGLHPGYLSLVETGWELTDRDDIAKLYRPRRPFSHKGHFGHALIVGGAKGKVGAAIMATEACLRSGAGLTSVYMLSEEYTAINSRCPEAMTVSGSDMVKKKLERYNVIGAGPGLGTDDIASHIISLILDEHTGALLLDADALNILAAHHSWLHQLPANTILTPHPAEFDRLFGIHNDDFSRIETALAESSRYNCVIVLKAHHTFISASGKGYFNNTGNAGLAKGGSGDALSGIIVSLLAQGYSAEAAARLGVYLHGLASDLAIKHQSYESLLASDVISFMGKAFKNISNVGYS